MRGNIKPSSAERRKDSIGNLSPFVSSAIEAGVDFKVIAGWVGHKDGGVLVAKTYGHLRNTHSFEMAKRMTFSVNDSEPANVVSFGEKISHH